MRPQAKSAGERELRPIALRLRRSEVELIDRAASARGRSRTDFMRDAALREAEMAILDEVLVKTGSQALRHFLKEISRPPRPVPELVALFRRSPPWGAAPSKRADRA